MGPIRLKDVALASVLAHEGGGEADASTRLQVGGELEHRSRKQVHLVVHDEAPVESIEQRQVRVLALTLRGQDLVGRDRDGLDLFGLTRVLADLLGSEAGALEQLVAPLAGRDGVGDEDQRGGLGRGHRAGATIVLPAPQGSTTTPEPSFEKASTASCW